LQTVPVAKHDGGAVQAPPGVFFWRYRIYKFHAYYYLYRLRKASSGVQGRRRRFCLGSGACLVPERKGANGAISGLGAGLFEADNSGDAV